MRISNTNSAQAAAEAKINSRKVSDDHEGASFSAILEDQTKLGSVASAVHQSSQQSEARVAQLRQQFLDGTYHVDAAALSKKIVDEHLG